MVRCLAPEVVWVWCRQRGSRRGLKEAALGLPRSRMSVGAETQTRLTVFVIRLTSPLSLLTSLYLVWAFSTFDFYLLRGEDWPTAC